MDRIKIASTTGDSDTLEGTLASETSLTRWQRGLRAQGSFITGLPRTRSAWLSHTLNYMEALSPSEIPVVSKHEYIRVAPSYKTYRRLLQNPTTLGIDCGSAVLPRAGDKVVIIDRHPEAVIESLVETKLFQHYTYNYLEHMIAVCYNRLVRIAEQTDCMLLDYYSLDKTDEVAKAFRHLGVEPDLQVIQQMQQLNVSVQYTNSKSILDFVKEGHDTIPIMLDALDSGVIK